METRKFIKLQTSVDCLGKTNVCVLCSQNNSWGTYWSSNILDEHRILYNTRGEATVLVQDDETIHAIYIKEIK